MMTKARVNSILILILNSALVAVALLTITSLAHRYRFMYLAERINPNCKVLVKK